MARRPKDLRRDSSVVLVGQPLSGDMDAWLASLVRNDPTELSLAAAELVAERDT